jgi:hypothetical protein
VSKSLEDVELGPRYGNNNFLVDFDIPIWKGAAPAHVIPAPPVRVLAA